MTAAASGLRHETSMLTAAAHQMSVAGNAALSAVTDITARAEASVLTLDAAGRIVGTVEIQVDRLTAVAGQAEAHASLLPDAAGYMTAATVRLQAAAEAWQSAPMQLVLPEVAARMEAAASTLDRLDATSSRLEAIVRGLSPEQVQAETLTAIACVSADIAASVRRVEAALSEHEGAWPSVAASIAQVEAAALAVAEASEHSAPGSPRASFLPATFDVETAPAAVIATLRHFDEVACQSEMLLQQAEALAEAVLAGRAPGLPPLLADRYPRTACRTRCNHPPPPLGCHCARPGQRRHGNFRAAPGVNLLVRFVGYHSPATQHGRAGRNVQARESCDEPRDRAGPGSTVSLNMLQETVYVRVLVAQFRTRNVVARIGRFGSPQG